MNTLLTLKRSLFFASIVSVSFMQAQQTYKMYTGPLLSVNTDFEKTKPNVVGTPYYNVNFLSADVGDSKERASIRYDAYLDKVEVLVNEKVYEIPKNDETPTFKFNNSAITLVYLKEENGFFFRLVNGQNQLLRKEKIKLHEVKTSVEPNSLIKEGYIKYEKTKPTYYIKKGEELFLVPKNTKELINHFPERKADLESFIKSNDIKIKQEESLIKLVQYLNK